jgi:carbon-monoxide dehydrogenase medium subunit
MGDHGDDAKLLAGGQSLVPMLALRLARFDHLIDLNKIPELAGIERVGDEIVVGALTRQSAAEHNELIKKHVPLLAQAIPKIGHFQIRNRGTIGGSIAHADPASELPCVALCLNATIVLAGPKGTREVAAEDFFVSIWQTAADVDEIVTQIRFPVASPQSGTAIEEFALRSGDFAIAGVTVSLQLDEAQKVAQAAIALLGMGLTPIRATNAERALIGQVAGTINLQVVAQLAIDTSSPSDDIHASAEYRKTVAAKLCRDALQHALEEAARG